MDRCAIFVDAGYALAAGGALCCETKARSELKVDYRALTTALIQFATGHSSLPPLRVYWYDGARNAVPTAEHLQVSELPNVKLRLGRLSGGEQKGVDSLIVRDLMTLARERAMVTAYLLAGDEDLREGVTAAQDMGVRVIVLGVPAPGGNQAQTLVRESDEHIVLQKDFLLPFFDKAKPATQIEIPSEDNATAAGRTFAEVWTGKASLEELRHLLAGFPVIPKELDYQLIDYAERSLGSLRDRQDLKKKVRRGFWDFIRAATPSVPG
jgi:hypothetical protein